MTNFKRFLASTALAGLFAVPALAGQEAVDIPKLVPASATAVITCNKLVVLIVTYQDGQVVRFDAGHMHGFTNAQDLMQYGITAKNTYSVELQCGTAV